MSLVRQLSSGVIAGAGTAGNQKHGAAAHDDLPEFRGLTRDRSEFDQLVQGSVVPFEIEDRQCGAVKRQGGGTIAVDEAGGGTSRRKRRASNRRRDIRRRAGPDMADDCADKTILNTAQLSRGSGFSVRGWDRDLYEYRSGAVDHDVGGCRRAHKRFKRAVSRTWLQRSSVSARPHRDITMSFLIAMILVTIYRENSLARRFSPSRLASWEVDRFDPGRPKIVDLPDNSCQNAALDHDEAPPGLAAASGGKQREGGEVRCAKKAGAAMKPFPARCSGLRRLVSTFCSSTSKTTILQAGTSFARQLLDKGGQERSPATFGLPRPVSRGAICRKHLGGAMHSREISRHSGHLAREPNICGFRREWPRSVSLSRPGRIPGVDSAVSAPRLIADNYSGHPVVGATTRRFQEVENVLGVAQVGKVGCRENQNIVRATSCARLVPARP